MGRCDGLKGPAEEVPGPRDGFLFSSLRGEFLGDLPLSPFCFSTTFDDLTVAVNLSKRFFQFFHFILPIWDYSTLNSYLTSTLIPRFGWVLDGLGSALMKATPISGIPLEKLSGCGPGFVPFGCGIIGRLDEVG